MSEILKKNLELISEYNKELVKKVLDHQVLNKPVQLVDSNSGDLNLLYDTDYVHDRIDPAYEAIEIYQKIIADGGSERVHIIYGLGLGYFLKIFAQKFNEKIIVIEPNLDILRLVLEIVDFSEELSQENIRIVSDNNELQKYIKNLSLNYKLTLSTTLFYFKNYQNELKEIDVDIKIIDNSQKIICEPCKLNIGAGSWKKEGWLTLDCYLKADIYMDLRKCDPFPVVNNVFEKVFSSHCIEHIEDIHLEFLLKELYRKMKAGAILRLSCPDADKALDSYRNNDVLWFDSIITKKGDKIGAKLLNSFVSYEAESGGPMIPEEIIREKFNSLQKEEFLEWCLSLCDRSRPYIAHINAIYYDKLEKMLKKVGFVDITRSSYRNSKDEELRGSEFDRHEQVSLFVECYKPIN